jgi:hypothetical protein
MVLICDGAAAEANGAAVWPSTASRQRPDGDPASSVLGVQRVNANEINALNFLDRTYQRRPLLPYLCVMAGRSEMKPEELMRESDTELATLFAANVQRIKADAAQCSKAEMNSLIAGAGLASRRISGALAASHKGLAGPAKTAASASKGAPANENEINTDPEMEMDDDSGRTPERVEQVRAEIRRRLGVVDGARESKSVDGGGALVAGGALLCEAKADGGAPEASG